jgi:hypothetical protein
VIYIKEKISFSDYEKLGELLFNNCIQQSTENDLLKNINILDPFIIRESCIGKFIYMNGYYEFLNKDEQNYHIVFFKCLNKFDLITQIKIKYILNKSNNEYLNDLMVAKYYELYNEKINGSDLKYKDLLSNKHFIFDE